MKDLNPAGDKLEGQCDSHFLILVFILKNGWEGMDLQKIGILRSVISL